MAVRRTPNLGVAIQQAVHGYKSGHRLLASSLELDAADRRLLARQTDSPDAGRVQNWEALMSGHPLPSGLYAVSMTWPAWEMPRPGCVWTHTLLLDAAAVAIQGSDLLQIFQRPKGPDPDLSRYRIPASAHFKQNDESQFDEALDWTLALAWAFYDAPVRPVRVTRVDLTDDARHLALLRTWSVAWSSLKRSLTFADAPKTPRTLDDQPFDMQLHQAARVEHTSQYRVLRGIPDATPPAWVSRAVAESQVGSGLTRFLETYGASTRDRGLMRPLVTIFLDHEQPSTNSDMESSERVLNNLVSTFPGPRSGRRLKVDVLNPSHAPDGCPRRLDEVGLLRALVRTQSLTALRGTRLDVSGRARRLIAADREGARLVLSSIDDPAQPLAAEFLASLLSELEGPELGRWIHSAPETAIRTAAELPELLGRTELWRGLPPDRLWALVARTNRDRIAALTAAMTAGVSPPGDPVFSAWRNATRLILDALTQAAPSEDLAAEWLRLLPAEDIHAYVSGPEIPPALLAAGVGVLPIEVTASLSPEELLAIVRDDWPSIEQRANILTAALMRPDDPEWAAVASKTYGRVHSALRVGEFAPSDEVLHALPAKREQDLPARFAKAMNKAFRGNAWPPAQVLDVDDKKAFQALVEADGKAVLARRVILDSGRRGVAPTAWQQTILKKAISARSDRESLLGALESLTRAVWKRV